MTEKMSTIHRGAVRETDEKLITVNRRAVRITSTAAAPAGRIMGSIAGPGGLAGHGGIAGKGGGIAG